MKQFVVASSSGWFPKSCLEGLIDNYVFIEGKDELTYEYLCSINPRYVFFPHWSWVIDEKIIDQFECVIFHTAPLPYGRGGSPIQNLILNKIRNSPVCALRATKDIDAGPIYLKMNVCLSGPAHEIFSRIRVVVCEMIIRMIAIEPTPKPQVGKGSVFRRRNPMQSELPIGGDLDDLYDHIRMLDADGYPKAFVSHGNWKLEISDARLNGDQIIANIVIKKK